MSKSPDNSTPTQSQKYTYILKKAQLKLPDMKIMWRIRKGEANDMEIVDWLDTVVEGGIADISMSDFGKLYEEIFRQFYDIDNPVDTEGKV
jgi:hypothetical protein